MPNKIAFLGPNGTFTEEAAHYFFGKENSYIPYGNIPDVIDAVLNDSIDYAVVPLENSIEGSVNLTIDWLIHEVNLPILSELILPIQQHLLTKSNCSYNEITKVFSHPQAIAQSRDFIRSYLENAEIIYTNSTAEAAEFISKTPDQPYAAIGTMLAKEIYDLKLMKESIQDYTNNFTRFILVGKKELKLQKSSLYKTMILVTLPEDYPGALHQVLAAFAWRKINLSRIESRPTKKGLGNYFFIMDIDQQVDEILMPGAFKEIEALGCHVRVLGSYPYFYIGYPFEENQLTVQIGSV